jgi:nanoRNase/pAp phosphatase (c-di-AMP/oligoRNAs hydrolase)
MPIVFPGHTPLFKELTLNRYLNEYKVLLELIKNKKEILIIVHNNPDPDAIASANALSFLTENLSNVKASIAYGGSIGRTENRVMVSKLNIHLKKIGKIKFSKYDLIALVDTQPHAGNNSLHDDAKINIVIDHHLKRKDTKADLVLVESGIGSTASIFVSWLKYSKLNIPVSIATTLAYAISSETQNLNREASTFDINAYLFIYPRSSIRKLAYIQQPKLSHEYYLNLAEALKKAMVYKNIITAYLEEIPSAEFAAEMADFFIRHKNISWCFCTGYKKDLLYLSIRSTRRNAKAGKIIKKIVKNINNVGGHENSAGGFIRIDNIKKSEVKNLCSEMFLSFINIVSDIKNNIELKPLIQA